MELAGAERIASRDHYLAVVSTSREDGSIQSSVVNAGFLGHPLDGEKVVGFVTYGQTKLANLRKRPKTTVVFRAEWQWAAVEGVAEIVGPDDALAGFDAERLPELLRAVFRSAGGTHDDWSAFDRVMADERRAAVLVRPRRIYSNRS
jgi:PPOX class probable F420-dependent enzyme